MPIAPPPHIFRALIRGLATTLLVMLCASQGLASEPKDRVICTTEPQSSWMAEAQARERFHAEQYLLLRFKISSENCHEFYAVERDGSVVEAYVHPITGKVVRFTRISFPKPPLPTPSSPAVDPQPPAEKAATATRS